MKRKIVQQGPATLMVSLPSKWVKSNGVKRGDDIDVEEKGSTLLFSVEKKKELSSIDIDVTGLDRSSIMLRVRSCYRKGYDQIRVLFKNTEAKHFREEKTVSVTSTVHDEVDRLIGVEIIDQKEDSIVIKDYSTTSIDEFDNSLRRIFLLLIDLSNDLNAAVEGGNTSLITSYEEKHDTITKFVSYSLRLLNKRGYSDPEKTALMYHIIDCMDMITDVFKYICRDLIIRDKISFKKQTKEVIASIDNSIKWYYELFYKYDNMKAMAINKNRDVVKKDISDLKNKIPDEELILITKMSQVLDIIWDLVLARMSIND